MSGLMPFKDVWHVVSFFIIFYMCCLRLVLLVASLANICLSLLLQFVALFRGHF